MSLASVLDKTGALERSTSAKDAIGGNTKTFATVSGLGSVKCSIAPASWRNTQELNRLDMIVEHEIYTATDVGAKIGDRWLIGGVYYPVLAYKRYDNAVFGAPVYVTICGRRNQ
jgi:hypothetical protein